MRQSAALSPCRSNSIPSPKNTSLSESESRVTYRAYAFATSKPNSTHQFKFANFDARHSTKPPDVKDLRNLLKICSISRNVSQSSVQRNQLSSLFVNRKLNDTFDHNPQQSNKMKTVGKSEPNIIKQNEKERPIQSVLKVKYLKVQKCTNLSLVGKSCNIKEKKSRQIDLTTHLIKTEQQINKPSLMGGVEVKSSIYKGKRKLKISQDEDKKYGKQYYQERPKEARNSLQVESSIDFDMIRRKIIQNMQKSGNKQNISSNKSAINLQKKSIASLNSSVLHKNAQQNPTNHPKSSTVFNIKYEQSFTKNTNNISRLHEVTFCQMTTPQLKSKSKQNDNCILTKYKKRSRHKPQRQSSHATAIKQPCLFIEEVEINRKTAKIEYYTSTKQSFLIEPIDILDQGFNKNRQQSTKLDPSSFKNYLRPKSSAQRRK